MFATMNVNHSPLMEQFRVAVESLSGLFAKQSYPKAADKPSTAFVPSRRPLNANMLREIERLELAIRQGSINA